MTPDPIGMLCGINLYSYALENPEKYFDLFGTKPWHPYPTQDEAARDACNDIYELSVTEDSEYGGYIYRNRDGTYTYGEPIPGTQHSFRLPAPPANATADYHSHGKESGPLYDDENFSVGDKRVIDRLGIDGYLVTPSGQIKKYSPGKPVRTIGKVKVEGKCKE